MTIGKYHVSCSNKQIWVYGGVFELFIGKWEGIHRSIKTTGRFAIGAFAFKVLFSCPYVVLATNRKRWC